jgi:hypothetical protein
MKKWLANILIVLILLLGLSASAQEYEQSNEMFVISEIEAIKARNTEVNVFQEYVPDFESIPKEKRRATFEIFNDLYNAEQKIVNYINMMPVADDELPKDEVESRSSWYHVPKGTDRNLGMSFGTYSGNSGGWGYQRNSSSSHSSLSSVRTNNTVRFNAGSWSWGVLERRIWITGSGSQWAGIHFGPINYWQQLSCNLPGDNANVRIWVQLWDVTSSPVTLLKSSDVINVSRNSAGQQQYSGSPSRSLYHQLQAGRTYAIRLVQEGSAACVSSDNWNGQISLGWTTKTSNLWINWYNW